MMRNTKFFGISSVPLYVEIRHEWRHAYGGDIVWFCPLKLRQLVPLQRRQRLAASSLMLAGVPLLRMIPVDKVPTFTFGGNVAPPVMPLIWHSSFRLCFSVVLHKSALVRGPRASVFILYHRKFIRVWYLNHGSWGWLRPKVYNGTSSYQRKTF